MRKPQRSKEELYGALHLQEGEIKRLFSLTRDEAAEVYATARKKDAEELADRVLFNNKVRMSSVRWAMGITKAQYEDWVERNKKSGLALEKPSALEVVE